VTKFFLGSYSLEGNLVPGGPDRRHTHSNYARKIANDLIVGYLESQKHPTVTVQCRIQRSQTEEISRGVRAIHFKAANQQANFRRFYPGLDMLGRHFTVKKLFNDVYCRQYTICNVMQPQVYKEVIKLAGGTGKNTPESLLNQTSDSSNENALVELLADQSSIDTMMFCIKDYSCGLSCLINM
jgi:hypothetical protein